MPSRMHGGNWKGCADMTTEDSASSQEQIAARVEKATPGPWKVFEDEDLGPFYVWTSDEEVYIANCFTHDEQEQAKADAEFIAHARTDIPYLLNELRASESARQ